MKKERKRRRNQIKVNVMWFIEKNNWIKNAIGLCKNSITGLLWVHFSFASRLGTSSRLLFRHWISTREITVCLPAPSWADELLLLSFVIQLSFQSEVWVCEWPMLQPGKLIRFLINLRRIHLFLCRLTKGQVGKCLQLSKSYWWLHGYYRLCWNDSCSSEARKILKKSQSYVGRELSPSSCRETELSQMFCFWTACEPGTIVS